MNIIAWGPQVKMQYAWAIYFKTVDNRKPKVKF